MMTIRQAVLAQAIAIVCKDREKDYGPPEDSFAKIASLWSAYLGQPVTSVQVAHMMILLKVARGTKLDNFVDIAGYAACAAEVAKANSTISLAQSGSLFPTITDMLKDQ